MKLISVFIFFGSLIQDGQRRRKQIFVIRWFHYGLLFCTLFTTKGNDIKCLPICDIEGVGKNQFSSYGLQFRRYAKFVCYFFCAERKSSIIFRVHTKLNIRVEGGTRWTDYSRLRIFERVNFYNSH